MLIPLSMALIGADGKALPLELRGDNSNAAPGARVLSVSAEEQEFSEVVKDIKDSLLIRFTTRRWVTKA